ncbi:MAG TPA: hypothetical protein VGT24_06680 [Candidatus Acidoferrales bacterium]|nr:hypothetical protein [Candidatus Acidoferrales bacterium]
MHMCLKTMAWIVCLAALSTSPNLLHAQMPAAQSGTSTSKASAPADPHNLSGMWEYFMNVPGQGIYATPSKTPPPMTDWAKARYDAAKPGYGPKAQAGGNDPILKCNPSGIPRILFFPQPFEIVQTPDRMFMFFERDHEWRQIWTDGRGHPKELDPTWMGDSIGKWEGDTFVVDTVGFNDKSWLDFYGDPHSEDMHLVERYRRVDQNSLSLQLIVEDPKAYTATWTGDTKTYKLLMGKKAYMEELPCIPEEEDAFTNRIRIPAASPKPNP